MLGRMTAAPDPLVSVLIPAYRAEETILRAIRPLLAGENGTVPTEILVEADDDNAYDAAAALPGVKVQRTGMVRSGVGAARNRALARARGAWVAYVDADDAVDDGYLPGLLATAGQGAGAFARTAVWQGGRCLAVLGGNRLTWEEAGRHGASWRGILRRDLCPAFVNDLSQDILHLAEVMLRQGELPIADTRYHLHLGAQTVTAGADFAERVEDAYLRHQAFLARRYRDAADLPKALALFDRKRALNAAYVARGAGRSYYDFVLAEDPV